MEIIRTIGTVVFILVVGLGLIAVVDVLFGKVSGRGSYLGRNARARRASRTQQDVRKPGEAKPANRSGNG
ncbi:hypothetical protein P3T18_001527 [Paraburkholderia sp. GAS199]